MNRNPNRMYEATRSLVALVALVVVLPAALVAVARYRFGTLSPVGRVPPPWKWELDSIRRAVSAPLADDAVVDMVIRTSLSIIWIAIAVIIVSIAVEVAHMVRHRGLPSPRVRGLGWAQRIARWVATGLVAMLPLGSVASIATASATDSPASTSQRWSAADVGPSATIQPGSTDDERRPSYPDQGVTTPVTVHVVARGESVYAIAAALGGGDAALTNVIADQILDLNLGATMNDGQQFANPALIQPGWTLTLPTGLAPRAPIETPLHEVVAGDTLFEIAGERLGDGDAWPRIWEANRGADMGGGRSFDDPNLIVAGWQLEIPTAPVMSPDTATDPIDERALPDALPDAELPDALPDNEPDDAVTAPPTPPRPTSRPGPEVADDGSPAPRNETTTAPVSTAVVTTPSGPTTDSVGSTDPAPQAPSPIRLEHAALLAAGVLTLVGVRRRRALRAALPHSRVPAPPPQVAATERRLRVVDPGERAARLDVAVRAASHRIAETGVRIGSVRIAKDGEVVVRLTGDGALPAPWAASGADPGRTWTLPAPVPIELLCEDARRVGPPCLALVTVGVDGDGRDVLVDLEAAGTTMVEARPDQADEIVRAIGAGLATSLTSEVAHLIVARVGADCLFDHPNAHTTCGVDEAIALALTLAGSTVANERSSFDLRARRTGGEMWEPAVMLFAAADSATTHAALADLPPPGHGIATVIAGDTDAVSAARIRVGARITGHPDRWVLDAFGEQIDLTPIGLTIGDVDDLTEVLADAQVAVAAAPIEPGDPTDPDDRSGDHGLSGQSVDIDGAQHSFEPTPHDIVVTMMGGVGVTDRNGRPGTFERSKTVELIAWLATHRDRATRTGARTALWELDVRDATFANVVSEARRALARLVSPPDGGEWLSRTLNESLPLHARVVTDADLVRERVEHARTAPPGRAIDVLRPAVELIRDMPFAGTSYLWPDADGITSNLVLLATTASAELAAHALSMGDTDLVFWATGQGLKVLPGHEELIGLRMRAHARAGDLAGVRQEWESYERVIMADSWSDGEPAPKLLELRRALLSPGA